MGRNQYTLSDCLTNLGFKMLPGGRAWSHEAKAFHQSIGLYMKENTDYDKMKGVDQFAARAESWLKENQPMTFSVVTQEKYPWKRLSADDQNSG